MADSNDHDRVNVLGGDHTGAGRAANHRATRNLRVDMAVDRAEGNSPAPAPAATSQSAGGIDFFKGRPASSAEKAAKQAALLKKLRERD